MAKQKKANKIKNQKSKNIDKEAILEESLSNGNLLEQDVEDLDLELGSEDLYEKVKSLEEALLRSRADLDNAFKRNISDVEKAHKYSIEKLLIELLPVVDNLEHALTNFSNKSSKEDKEGVELTLKSFESTLDKFGIRPIYPLNEQFDPIKHEAVMTSKDLKKQDNEIENIFQRGWELHERVVRPARVSVIKN
ncbi:MAG: nucleotide exchange factor GrpE [Gammaproteobacteria bacterium]|nr:nucleotide exchange factor GrpE [Gammaproteobacteria bacterium]|tara:strand:- start:1368 stop:1946 length:579 start_codon:yes stop_codon:yes gene_type:complete